MNAAVSAPVDCTLLDALAEELVLASRHLADLAFDLGSDEAVLRRHMAGLQAIDHVTQAQLAIATALRGLARQEDVVAAFSLEDMKQRVLTAVGG